MKEKRKILSRSLAALVTAVTVVAVLLLNVLLSVFVGDRAVIDLTSERFNRISDESKGMLKGLDPEENNFTIYFLADKDELQSTELGYSVTGGGSEGSLWGMKYVYELAKVFAENYSFVSVKLLNIKKDADKLEQFRTTVGTKLTKQDVIIDNYTYETDSDGNAIRDENGEPIMHHNFRVCKRDSFFVFDSGTSRVYAFNGDLRFTSTILSLAGKNPTVYFVSGHGEEVGDESTLDASMNSDYGKATALRDLFFRAGFATKKINLETEYETLFKDDSARILVIYGPKTDYKGAYDGGVDEIAAVRKFLNGIDHNAMVFLDNTENPLSNLEEFVSDYFGINVGKSIVKDNGANSLSPDGYTFISDYETDQYSIGINLTAPFSNLESKPMAVFENARTFTILPAFSQNGGFYDDSTVTTTGAVFRAPKSSVAVEDGKQVADFGSETPSALMALCLTDRFDEKSNQIEGYMLFCGTSDFAADKYVNSASYCNADILYYTMRLMGRENVPFSIDFKVIKGQALENISKGEATGLTVLLCTLVPAVMVVLGTVVFVKRRHR